MAKKKSVKAGSKAKTKVGKGAVSLRELPGRHMRLTQEFDRLATVVAQQGQLLQGIYLVLQQARLMPHAPVEMLHGQVLPKAKGGAKVDQGAKIPVEQGMQGSDLLVKKTQLYPVSGTTPDIREYDVVLLRNGQALGYLTEAGTWTLDPKQIKTWIIREDAEVALSKAAFREGAEAKVRGHSYSK